MKQVEKLSLVIQTHMEQDQLIRIFHLDAQMHLNLLPYLTQKIHQQMHLAPELTLGTITGTFTRGEKITGSSSGATGRIIDITSP